MKAKLCECGCGRRVLHPKDRFLHGHHMRLPHNMGVTHSNKPGKKFVPFDVEKEIGSFSDSRPFGFLSKEEAFEWWGKNRKPYMKEHSLEFLEMLKTHKDKDEIWEYVPLADRPEIFWQLEFGFSPEENQRIYLLESHSLWYPSERDLILKSGKKIPKVKFTGCLLHPCGSPIKWPSESSVKLEDGELYFCDCQATRVIREGRI